MKPVDTHCHLDFEKFDGDRDEVIARCAAEMAAVINSGTNPERNRASLALADEHAVMHATLGLHPTYIEDITSEDIATVMEQIRENADRILAVGEIGLDYHHVHDEELREEQADLFRRMLDLAVEVDLPVVLHTRDAEQDAFDIVQEFPVPGVVQHCFNGPPDLAREAVDAGHYISVSTQVLHSERVRNIADAVPLDRILLETDAPFLYRGERNAPWHVTESAERIAAIKDVAVQEVIDTTTENAGTVLDIPV